MIDLIRRSLAVIAGVAAGTATSKSAPQQPTSEPFVVSTVLSGLNTPWDLAWGPDGMIWFSERGGRISRLDPATGARTTAGSIDVHQVGEGGLMGIAFHPDFASSPYVYAMHTYGGFISVRNKLVRMRWNGTVLGRPETLLDGLPGAAIHNGSRIAVGPDRMLYVTTGDAGNGQAQDLGFLGGKVLRLTLDGKPAPGNPFDNAVWSYGHRNGQGLVFHPTTGVLYETEHGPNDNDEVNIIRRGGNYGWPNVHGFCDDDSGSERDFCRAHNVVEPLAAWTPTIAITGADFYLSDRIPGWKGSLLATSLKAETLFRFTLSPDGTKIVGREPLLATRYGRLRDVLVAPNGDIYVATSNRDGRGSPARDDDRILRLTPKSMKSH